MKPPWRILLLVAAALLQLAAPVSLIMSYENTLAQGKVFKVRCRPVDPEDAFRGRYLTLDLQIEAVSPAENPQHGFGWLELMEGPDGFARVKAFHDLKGPRCEPCVKGRERFSFDPETERSIPSFHLEVTRFYLEEQRARRLDPLFAKAVRERTVWAVIRAKNGVAAIENVYIDGKPVGDL